MEFDGVPDPRHGKAHWLSWEVWDALGKPRGFSRDAMVLLVGCQVGLPGQSQSHGVPWDPMAFHGESRGMPNYLPVGSTCNAMGQYGKSHGIPHRVARNLVELRGIPREVM